MQMLANRDLMVARVPRVAENGCGLHIHAPRASTLGCSTWPTRSAEKPGAGEGCCPVVTQAFVSGGLGWLAGSLQGWRVGSLRLQKRVEQSKVDRVEEEKSSGPRTVAASVIRPAVPARLLCFLFSALYFGLASRAETRETKPKSGRLDLNQRPLRPERIRSESDNTSFASSYDDAVQAMHHWMHQILNPNRTHALDELADMLYGSLAPSECYQLMAAIHERIDAGRRSQRET